jgi:flagellar assembly factor FliW
MTPLDTGASIHGSNRTDDPGLAENSTRIGTRFGTFVIDLSKAITMPQGPLGFANLHEFAVLDVPDAPDSAFKLFQSIDDPSVTFIVTPMPERSDLIAEDDLVSACMSYSITRENAAFLLITKVRKDPAGNRITSVNLRAPIVVDMVNRVARQAVFGGERYPMQYDLQGGNTTG